jgi:hypothetical protein
VDQLDPSVFNRYSHPDFDSLELGWLGQDLAQGPLPAFFYFALSLEDTLLKAPFDFPAKLAPATVRCFSASLPFHQKGQNEQHTIDKWVEFEQQTPFMEQYLEKLTEAIVHLSFIYNELHLIGLSRGAWICLQLAKRLKQRNIDVQTLTLFAPLCDFSMRQNSQTLPTIFSAFEIDLSEQKLWMSISCCDTRVGTETALALFQKQQDYDPKGLRHHRLILYPAVGYKGHGTPEEIFQEGMQWLYSHVTTYA